MCLFILPSYDTVPQQSLKCKREKARELVNHCMGKLSNKAGRSHGCGWLMLGVAAGSLEFGTELQAEQGQVGGVGEGSGGLLLFKDLMSTGTVHGRKWV